MESPYSQAILQVLARNTPEYIKEDTVEDTFTMLMASLRTVEFKDRPSVIKNFLVRHSSATCKNPRMQATLQNVGLMEVFGHLFQFSGIWTQQFVRIAPLYDIRHGTTSVSSSISFIA